jgi:hypothetical protein
MDKKKNIEDIFKNAFEGYVEKPSAGSWSKVDSKIKVQRINYQIKHAFDNFKITPSSKVWQKINATIWFPRFLKFNISQFNIYYAAFALLLVTSSIIIVNNIQTKDKGLALEANNLFVDKQYKLIINNRVQEQNTNFIFEEQYVSEPEIHNNNVYAQAYSDEKQELLQDINEGNSVNINEDNLIVTAEEKDIITEITINENITEKNEKSIVTEDIDYTKTTDQIEWWMPKLTVKGFVLPYIPQIDVYITPTPSALANRDEIVPDTVGIDAFGEPIVIYNNCVSIEPYFGVSSAISQYSALTTENNLLAANYQNGVNSNISYHYGMLINLRQNDFNISCGLSYSHINEDLNTEKINQIITEYPYFDYFENQYTDYDTTLILDLNAWLQGDTVYYELIDSININFTDSVLLFSNDTVYNSIFNHYKNSATYFEIPLSIGYSFGGKNLSITPSVGVVTGFLSGATGTYLNPSTGNNSEITVLKPYNKLLFSLQGSVKFRYYFEQHFGIMLEPWYRQNLNNVYQDISGVYKTDMRYGINFGLTYRF